MHLRVYYLINRSGECVSSTSAIEMTPRQIREQLLDRLQSEDDYLGLLDAEGRVLQILPEPAQARFYVEVPLDAAKASYGCYMTRDELNELILNLPTEFTETSIPGLTYKPW